MPNRISRPPQQRGFTLVELMISLILALLVASAAGLVFLQSKRNFLQNEQVSRIQENGRFALKNLVRDISMAGFTGEQWSLNGLTNDSSLTNLAADCGPAGWYFDVTGQPLLQLEDGPTGNVTGTFPCIAAADYKSNGAPDAATDAIAIKRTTDAYAFRTVFNAGTECEAAEPCCGTTTPAPGAGTPICIAEDRHYLQTNKDNGRLYHDTILDPNPPPVIHEIWGYLVHVYFIRPWSVTLGDGIPSLCRKVLVNNQFLTECLAEGIENMQIELGIDDDQDGVVDFFTASPVNNAQLAQAIQARIFLLVRAVDDLNSVNNNKTYVLGNVTLGPFNDGFYRRVFTTNVQLRNILSRNLPP